MMPGQGMILNSNYLITGTELIEHADGWNLYAVDIANEREEQKRELQNVEKDNVGKELNKHAIQGIEDLSEADQKAVQQMREQFGNLFKPR